MENTDPNSSRVLIGTTERQGAIPVPRQHYLDLVAAAAAGELD